MEFPLKSFSQTNALKMWTLKSDRESCVKVRLLLKCAFCHCSDPFQIPAAQFNGSRAIRYQIQHWFSVGFEVGD